MIANQERAKNVIDGLEKFSGHKGEFSLWKDKVLTHVKKMDQRYQQTLLEKSQDDATILMIDFLDGTPVEPPTPEPTLPQAEKLRARWMKAHWSRGKMEMHNLLVQAAPNSFSDALPVAISQMESNQIWKALEKTYGLGDAGGLIELTNKWNKIMGSNWKNLSALFGQLKKLRNDINRKTQALVGQDMITEAWLCVQILAQLPCEFWASSISMNAEGFTIENVENALRVIFGDKNKRDIQPHMEKRQTPIGVNAVRRSIGIGKKRNHEDEIKSKDKCFYCFDPKHYKKDCPLMKADRDPQRSGGPLFRTDVKSEESKKRRISVMTVKPPAMTALEASIAKGDEIDVNGMDVPMNSPQSSERSIGSDELDMLEFEVRKANSAYLDKLLKLKLTPSLYIIDTGAGHAITSDKGWFTQMRPSNQTFVYGNNSTSNSGYLGSIKLEVFSSQQTFRKIELDDVAFDKNCGPNLISAFHFAKQGYRFFQSKDGKFLFFMKSNCLAFAAVAIGDVYYLPSQKHRAPKRLRVSSATRLTLIERERLFKEWHLRLGHVNQRTLIRILTSPIIAGTPCLIAKELKDIIFQCRTCNLAKARRMSYRNMSGTKTTIPLHTLHMDSVGKFKVRGTYGAAIVKYAVGIVDDATSFRWYFPLKSLKEVPERITTLITQLERQHPGRKVRKIRTDGGTEFVNEMVSNYCASLGLLFEKSNVECQEENGSSERSHQTNMAKVRCSLLGAGMEAKWWPEALMYATDVSNRLPMERLNHKTPFEMLYGKLPNGMPLKIWGSVCYAHIPETKRSDKKLSARALECRLLGLSHDHKGYRLLDVANNKYLIARDVRFGAVDTANLIKKSFILDKNRLTEMETQEILEIGQNASDETAAAELDSIPTIANGEAGEATMQAVGASGAESEDLESFPVPTQDEDAPRPKRHRRVSTRLREYDHKISTVLAKPLVPIPRSLKEARSGQHAKQGRLQLH
jgi:hypothetical protein